MSEFRMWFLALCDTLASIKMWLKKKEVTGLKTLCNTTVLEASHVTLLGSAQNGSVEPSCGLIIYKIKCGGQIQCQLCNIHVMDSLKLTLGTYNFI